MAVSFLVPTPFSSAYPTLLHPRINLVCHLDNMSNSMGEMSVSSMRDEPDSMKGSAKLALPSQPVSSSKPRNNRGSGYLLDSTDVGLSLFSGHSSRRGVGATNGRVLNETSTGAAHVAHRAPAEGGFYAEDATGSVEPTHISNGARRATGLGSFDWNAPPFALTSSTDSLSSASSVSTPTSAGEAPIKLAEIRTSQNDSAASLVTTPPTSSPRPRASTQGSSPDVNYPTYMNGEGELPLIDPTQPPSLDSMFSDIKKDGLVSFLKILETAGSDNKDIVDLSTALRRHIANRAAAAPAVKDWNNELQNLLDMDPSEEKYLRLRELAHDFNLTASVYAKILISELFLSPSEKTIPPSTIGGIAGGTKFICQGILFKFAVDVQLPETSCWMYGKHHSGTEFAMKAAGSELRHIVALSNAVGDTELRVPLMALIDYRGFRLVASSLLPIASHTIVYGSDNGGANVYADPEAGAMFDTAAKRLNLKKHRFGDAEISGPVDIEIHRGEDNRYYVIDLARLYPPEAPELSLIPHPRSNYFKMLRPCLVSRYQTALSSDAFSGFGRHDEEIHNTEVYYATKYLQEVVIPETATHLSENGKYKVKTSAQLVQILHKAGINLRYLGLLRTHLKEQPQQQHSPSSSSLSSSSHGSNDPANALLASSIFSGLTPMSSSMSHLPAFAPASPHRLARDSVLQSDSSLNSSATTTGIGSSETAIGEGQQKAADGINISTPSSARSMAGSNGSVAASAGVPAPLLAALRKPLILPPVDVSTSSSLDSSSNSVSNSTGSPRGERDKSSPRSAKSFKSIATDSDSSATASSNFSTTTSPSLPSPTSSSHKRKKTNKSRSVDRSSERRSGASTRVTSMILPPNIFPSDSLHTYAASPLSNTSQNSSFSTLPHLPNTGPSTGPASLSGSPETSNPLVTSVSSLSVHRNTIGGGIAPFANNSGMGSPLSGSFTTLPGYSPEMQQRKNTIGSIRQVILREMIARSLKARLRQTWRRTMQNHRISIEAPFADAVLMLLNTVFYKDGELSDHFWKTSLIQDLIQKFRVGLTEDELSGSFSLYHTIDSFQLFKTFTAMVGVRINWDISQLNRPERRFMFTDIESIDCIVRPMNIVTISEGILLAMMAASETDPTQHLELLNMAENHLTNAYTATGNPLVTAELGHIRYSRMQSGSLEDRHKDAEAAFMSYAEALLQHRAEMKDSEPASVPVLARGGTLRSASTSSNAFQHNTALRLLELAFIYLPGDPNLMRLARCTQPQQLHTMIARWMLTLHRTRPKTATINPVLVLVRRIFATLNGLPLLLDSLQYAQNELMELIRAELYQTVEWKLSGQQRIFETSETSLAALVEISKLADKNFWLPHLHTLDFSCVYTLMDKHLEVILPLCPNLTSLNISGCPRLTIRLAELLPLHRMTPLQTLNISQCIGITDDFFLELKPLLRSLTNVNVSECPEITETTLFLLSRGAPNLSALAISGCTGITSFHSLEQFVNLRSLECCKLPSMDPLHLAALLRKTSPPMHRLIANGNPQLIDSTFEMMTGTTSLVEVQIAESSITSATLEIMIKFAPELEVLDISDCSKLSLDIMGERLAGFTKLKALHTRGQTHFSVGPLFTTLRDQLVALDISMSSHSVQSVLLKSTPPNLTALNISRCNDFIATALLEFGNMQSLTHLNMAGCVNVTDGVLAGLLEKVKGLTRLELAFCAQLTASAPALIGKNCPQLRILDMDSCVGIDQPRLAEIGYGCRELMELRMSRINLRNSATIKSLFRGGLSSLRVVKLKDCHMTDESLKEIASFSPALQDLDVADNPDLTNQGVKHLFQHCHFLEHLILTGAASISDDAFPKSTKRRLRSLRTLSLSGCKAVTDATISLLSRRCFLLSSLNISGCNEISADSIKALMQSAPHLCELRALVCAHIPPGSLDIPSEDRASPLLKVVY